MKKTTVTKRKISKSQILAIVAAILMVVQNYIDLSDILPYLNQIIEGICGVLVMVGVIADGGQQTVEEIDAPDPIEPTEAKESPTEGEIIKTTTFELKERNKNE